MHAAADWEKTGWAVNGVGDRIVTFTRAEFLAGKAFKRYPNRKWFIEAPHIQERKERSVAQVYSRSELEILSANATLYGCTIMAFPAKMSPRARHEVDVDKTMDSYAIRIFAETHSEIGMMEWKLPTKYDEDKWARRDDTRKDMSYRLNVMRPDYDHPEVDRAKALFATFYEGASDDLKSFFPAKVVNKGKTNERIDVNEGRLMSVYVAVFNSDGTLRLNDQGSFIGVREVMALLWMNPYHGRGGTARSNLIYWTLRPRETAIAGKGVRVPEVRRSFQKAIKELVQLFRGPVS